MRLRAGIIPALLACSVAAAAQAQHAGTEEIRRVDGRVMRGTRTGENPVAGVWVTLHRVGSDHAGPLDSMRTNAAGRYRFSYRPTGIPEAIYFVSASYGGIAYFSPPLRDTDVTGDDAMIVVFDTTSGPVALHVAGRHLVVGSPDAGGRRPVGEVFELQNDSAVTAVARDTIPVWETRIPRGATGFEVTASGDIPPAAVHLASERVGVFAPFSPGMRQLAFTYDLPRDGVPMRVALETGVEMLEVLVQEPGATISGGNLTEVAPVQAEGRMFRRFLAHSVPAGSEIVIELPTVLARNRMRIMIALVLTILAAMTGALVYATRGRAAVRSAASSAAAAERPTGIEPDALVRELAELDAGFEARIDPDDAARAAYQERRAELKARLTALLAGPDRPA